MSQKERLDFALPQPTGNWSVSGQIHSRPSTPAHQLLPDILLTNGWHANRVACWLRNLRQD